MSKVDIDRLRRHAHDEQEEDDGLIADAADEIERYIQVRKCSECNDKDGEMARLSVEIERLQAILPRTADEGPHDAEPYYFTRESR